MQELVRYLLENLYLDFQGDISVERVREFLRDDDSREARALLSKIIEEKGVDDLLLALADCLKEQLRSGITEKTIREQLTVYTEASLSGSRAGGMRLLACDLGGRKSQTSRPLQIAALDPQRG